MNKKVVVSVINDLVTDQRVNKSCQTLTGLGFDVLLVGRKLKSSLPMDERPYKTHRMKLLFNKGPIFYACYNFRLFFILLFRKSNLLVANDLDTLLPNYLISKLKGVPLVFDSHEYFTEVPELVNRKSKQIAWKRIERWIVPNLKTMITVNDSIASLFEKEYGIKPTVVRNVSPRFKPEYKPERSSFSLPDEKNILILQGSGINIQRGAEEMVEAIQFIPDSILLIVGGGDVLEVLKQKVRELKLEDRVVFKPKQPYDQLIYMTSVADIGLTLDKDTNINYRYSLPNKLFDYIQAGIPVLSSPLPELKKIISTYEIGDFIPSHEPREIASKVNEILANQDLMEKWKKNVNFAASQLSWENEEQQLINIYTRYV